MNRNQLRLVVDEGGTEWLMPSGIAKRFGLKRTAVYYLLKEFRNSAKYKTFYLDLNYRLKLINVKQFENFLRDKSRNYLRT